VPIISDIGSTASQLARDGTVGKFSRWYRITISPSRSRPSLPPVIWLARSPYGDRFDVPLEPQS